MIIRTDCRCCRGESLIEVFNLGEQPYANAYLSAEQLGLPEQRCSLVLCECADCGMIQLRHVVDATDLFSNYSFLTGSSQRMVRHFAELMRENIARYVPANGLVVEIGSNDGTALSTIPSERCRRLGIDPARNLSDIAHERNVPYITEFFTEILARKVLQSHGSASLIVACNVMGHVDDLDDLCRGVKLLLHPDGALVIEVPCANWMLSRTEFDTIYHEHLSYFGIRPLATLFSRHGLRVTQIRTQEVHGGSVRLTMLHGEGHSGQVTPWVEGEMRQRDWTAFGGRCEESRERFIRWLTKARDGGRLVVGYGAPAKATVRLNYCNIGTDLLPLVVDSTPNKQGKFIPGTHQPICDPSRIEEQITSDVVILAWNHEQEITTKLAGYKANGGRVSSVITLPGN